MKRTKKQEMGIKAAALLVGALMVLAVTPAAALAAERSIGPVLGGQYVNDVPDSASYHAPPSVTEENPDESLLGDQPGDYNEDADPLPGDESDDAIEHEGEGIPTDEENFEGDDIFDEGDCPDGPAGSSVTRKAAPPVSVLQTAPPVHTEDTPTITHRPHRDRLPFTGGNAIAYVIAGLAVVALGAVVAMAKTRKNAQ